MTRIHLLALPNVQTTREYSLDGFAAATIRFAKLLKSLNYHVILYGSEENEAPCDEFVSCISKAEQRAGLGASPYQYASINECHVLWQTANPRMIAEIGKRKQPRDFICTIGGASQKPVADAHPDLMCVEYSIGYIGSFSKYRVFESSVWRHVTYGAQHIQDGRFFDTVIPLFFEPSDFIYCKQPGDYFLYVGRLVERKGIGIACAAAKAAGVPLKVIGHGNTNLITYGHYLGALSWGERNQWMSNARAVFCPTQYIEPFGCTAVEAQFGGTPVISTDWGGYVETVVQGVTGFRCTYLGEFVDAVRKVGTLNREFISARASRDYSISALAPQYDRYFKRLNLLWGDGWHSLSV